MSGRLFHKPSSGSVIAHDIEGNTQKIPIRNLKFRVSVYGILKNKDCILLHWNPLVKRYNIPGGAVELGETISDALIREYEEETGISIRIKKLLGVKQDFLVVDDEYAHSILLFYEVEKINEALTTHRRESDSDGAELISLAKIKREDFTPAYREILESL
jgi:ADP-ribose pyrophosphatase YjhB (NUDIX family)